MTQKTKKASILAFTLIMLGILLAAGLSLMGATLVDQRTAIDSGKAIQSLQTAESGTDIAVSRISNDPTSDLATIFPASLGYNWIDANTVTKSAAQGDFMLTFLDKDGNELSSSSAKGSEVESIKSIGTYAGINRAIEVALAASDFLSPCGSSWGYLLTGCAADAVASGESFKISNVSPGGPFGSNGFQNKHCVVIGYSVYVGGHRLCYEEDLRTTTKEIRRDNGTLCGSIQIDTDTSGTSVRVKADNLSRYWNLDNSLSISITGCAIDEYDTNGSIPGGGEMYLSDTYLDWIGEHCLPYNGSLYHCYRDSVN